MVCWGDSNRSVLMRVPLGWIAKTNMIKDANPQERGDVPYIPGKQTVELRSQDGSADLYHLMAAIIMAAKEGILAEDSLEKANKIFEFFNVNGIDAIIDDMDENLSSKIKKFNLIGVPFQIIIGKKSDGDLLEFKEIGKDPQNLTLDQILKILIKQKEKN